MHNNSLSKGGEKENPSDETLKKNSVNAYDRGLSRNLAAAPQGLHLKQGHNQLPAKG